MAETARKRFDINEKFSTNRRVGKTDFRTDCTKRALNVARIDKQNTGLIHVTNLADLRTDGVPKAQIRIANRLSRLSRKAFRRNSVSVEQIQDTSQRLIVLTSLNTTQANDL